MNILDSILASVFMLGGTILVVVTIFKYNKESHKKENYSSAGDNLVSFIFGIILQILPWWITKIVLIVMGIGLLALGIMMFLYVPRS